MSEPVVSIVLATRNRGSILPQTLASYEHLASSPPWELIVVDNGSNDDTPAVLAAQAAKGSYAMAVLEEPRPGASRARNRGWRVARGSIVAFTDDDCYPAPDLVAEIERCMRAYSLDYLGGRILLHDPDDLPFTIQLRETPVSIAARELAAPGLIQGANLAMRREVLVALGGYDEMLGAGTRFSCEDLDLQSRASAAGYAGAYRPEPTVRHHHRRRTWQQAKPITDAYDIGRGAFYAKCLLDPARRGTLRLWRETAAEVLTRPRSRRVALARLARELRGAVQYLFARATRRRSGAGGAH